MQPYIPTNQDRIDTIIRSLHNLPKEELEQLSLDLTKPILDGSPEAERLFALWEQRQRELQDVMKTLMKPAEYMASLIQKLMKDDELTHTMKHIILNRDTTTTTTNDGESETMKKRTQQKASLLSSSSSNDSLSVPLTLDEKLAIFEELESLLTDIDNARDFHTIGAWPYLISHLHRNQPDRVRAMTLWCVGSLVKNSYDYQLFLLEPLKFQIIRNNSGKIEEYETNTLEMILTTLEESVSRLAFLETERVEEREIIYDLIKKSLYALSSALRGNIDIQERIITTASSMSSSMSSLNSLHSSIYRLLNPTNISITIPSDVTRKAWSLLSDTLDEREEIRSELVNYLRSLDIQHEKESSTGTISIERESEYKVQREAIILALTKTQLLGDSLVIGLPFDNNNSHSHTDSDNSDSHTDSTTASELFVNILIKTLPNQFHRFKQLFNNDNSNQQQYIVETAITESTLRCLLSISRHLLKASPPSLPSISKVEVSMTGEIDSHSSWPHWQTAIQKSIQDMTIFYRELENAGKQDVLERYEDLFGLVKINAELLQLR